MSKYVTRKLTEDELEIIQYCDGGELFEIVDAGHWTVDYKYQHKTTIFKDKLTGKLYSWDERRSGNHQEWNYESDDEAYEVYPVEKIVKTVEYFNVKA